MTLHTDKDLISKNFRGKNILIKDIRKFEIKAKKMLA